MQNVTYKNKYVGYVSFTDGETWNCSVREAFLLTKID